MNKKSGFTLVEIMIVVAIIGLLAAVGIPAIMNSLSNAQAKAAKKNVASVEKAKAMMQLPSTIHAKGLSLQNAATFEDSSLLACMSGTADMDALTVNGSTITKGAIGTQASY